MIEGGEVYDPHPAGPQAVLLGGDKIVKIGPAVDRGGLQALGLDYTLVDASGCFVVPGLIDPHQHINGAGGEQGWATRTPEVNPHDIALAGITTVVGCLGTDTTTRSLPGLLAKARQLRQAGLSAYIYTGGFTVPPLTFTGSVRDDLVLIPEVIGLGELAISDTRSSEPSTAELARLVSDALVGGTIGAKAGVTHFHLGPGRARLKPLRDLLDRHEIPPEQLYPTHITRSPQLLDEAIALARRGAFVDMDTVEQDLGQWLRYYRQHDGPLDRLTVSSDAQVTTSNPGHLYGQLVECVHKHGLALAEILPLFTRNPAAALKLTGKGELKEQAAADVLVLDKSTLAVVHLFAGGRQLVRQGRFEPPAKGG